MNRIVLIGGGGHCSSIIDTIKTKKDFIIEGIIEKSEGKSEINGVKIIGTDEDLEKIYNNGCKNAVISVGSIGDPKIRIKLYKKLKNIGYEFPIIIDKSSIIAENVNIEEGVFVGKGSIINSNSIIKRFSIINSGSIIEHDCYIGEFVHIAPGAVLSGGSKVGKNSHVGTNATIIQGITIGNDSLIGAGSVVIKNIGDRKKVLGNPGREVFYE